MRDDVERRKPRFTMGFLLVPTLLAMSIVVVAAVAAYRDGYAAFGDQAVFALRSSDVSTSNTPLLGMPSTTDAWTGVPSFHPGPLPFWLFWPFVKLLGVNIGPLAGMATLGASSIAGIAVVCRRHLGNYGAGAATATSAALYMLAGGPSMLYRPINPTAVYLPFIFFLVASWAVACGDRRIRPCWALAGSLAVQAELAYVPITVAVGATALALSLQPTLTGWLRGAWERTRTTWRDLLAIPAKAGDDRHLATTLGMVTATKGPLIVGTAVALASVLATIPHWLAASAVALLCIHLVRSAMGNLASNTQWRPNSTMVVLFTVWLVPSLQQIFGRPGNVTSLLRVALAPAESSGLEGTLTMVGAIAGNPLRLMSNDFFDSFQFQERSRLAPVAILLLVTLLIGSIKKQRQDTLKLGAMSAAAVVGGGFAGANLPVGQTVYLTHVMWALPLIALFWTSIIVGLSEALGPNEVERPSKGAGAYISVGILLASLLIVVPRLGSAEAFPIADWEYQRWQHDALPVLVEELHQKLPDENLRLFIAGGGSPELLALSLGLMAQLDSPKTKVATSYLVNYLGAERDVFTGSPADASLWVLDEPVPHPPLGSRKLVEYAPSAWDPTRVVALSRDLRALVDSSGPLVLAGDPHQAFSRVSFGRRPDVCPNELGEGYPCTPEQSFEDLTSLDDRTILDLYRAGVVASPVLPPDLQNRLAEDASSMPVSIWIGPPPRETVLDPRFS